MAAISSTTRQGTPRKRAPVTVTLWLKMETETLKNLIDAVQNLEKSHKKLETKVDNLEDKVNDVKDVFTEKIMNLSFFL